MLHNNHLLAMIYSIVSGAYRASVSAEETTPPTLFKCQPLDEFDLLVLRLWKVAPTNR